jgi:HEAT repeat protein
VRLNRWAWLTALLAIASLTTAGCGLAPKNFRKVTDPAPIVRARSVSLSEGLPEGKVVPALIDRLEDKDPVVRLAAAEELRQGTGRTFDFVPWGSDADRSQAVARWREWWKVQRKLPDDAKRNP